MREKHNAAISAKVGSLFDCDIWMPNELNSFKTGKDFFWASTNLNDMNFVMYSYPFRDNNTFTKEFFIHKRDSVMKINIPGSMEGMYMETADSIFVDVKNIAVKGDYAFEARGLWEMRNDAMGGPFVSHVRVDRMRKLEACLYTLKLPAQKEVFELPIGAGVTEITITGDSIK